MFKKDVGVKNFTNLKNTERKRFLGDQYPNYKIPAVVKKSIFKNQQTKGTIYATEQLKPLWFKLNDTGEELIPTIYTLWENPGLLPVVRTHDVVVYNYLVGGADLMLPGTVPPFGEELRKGQLVAIVSRENDLVSMAVGKLTMDLNGISRVVGTTGVAVKILHHYGDMLYKSYQAERLDIPTNKDLEGLVVEQEVANEAEAVPEQESVPEAESEPESEAEPEHDQEQEQEQEQEPMSEAAPETRIEVDDVAETLSELSVEDVDHFFHRSLLYSLSQETIAIPISSSSFMSNHIIKNLQINSNIKKTSYKKTAKWLKHLEKAGYLKLKGKGDDLTIIEVIKKDQSDELKNFVPYKVPSKKDTPQQTPSAKQTQMQVTNYYSPHKGARQFFDANDLQSWGDAMYTQPELRKILDDYIKKAQLVHPKDKKQIVINDLLGTVIKVKGSSTITRDKILQEFLKNFTKSFQITYINGKKSPFYHGEVPKVKILLETPMGNKQTTKIKIADFEIYGIIGSELMKELKIKCSSSTTMNDDTTASTKKGHEIMVQGAHDKVVISHLTKQYGMPVSWIEVENKLKNNRRKRK